MTWSNLAKLISGFVIAITLVVGGGYLVAQRLVVQFTAPPPKPVFPNDQSAPVAKASPAPKPASGQPSPAPQASPQSNQKPAPSPSPSPSPTDGYPARITLDIGLNVRSNPNRDAERIGGVDYNQRVVVLEESQDKEWLKVRVEGTNLEGWVRGGYAEKVN